MVGKQQDGLKIKNQGRYFGIKTNSQGQFNKNYKGKEKFLCLCK
jgi:hypothetical protein